MLFRSFGLLTFGRYLGAYADCGWAWNKRPSATGARGGSSSSKRSAAWRRNMPSAEFVECLVIFIYGASNTWMERFGAQPGDPYTIKQIQHISIAVMFWFAGLMGMLLETKFIRNMLSFPIAYHHVAAVPLNEVRRRRCSSRGRLSMHGNEGEADAELLLRLRGLRCRVGRERRLLLVARAQRVFGWGRGAAAVPCDRVVDELLLLSGREAVAVAREGGFEPGLPQVVGRA